MTTLNKDQAITLLELIQKWTNEGYNSIQIKQMIINRCKLIIYGPDPEIKTGDQF